MQPMRGAASQFFRRRDRTTAGGDLLGALAACETLAAPVVAVVAHPDDETIGMGSRLATMANLTLVYATDGSPPNMVRARSLGFESAETYSRARFDELVKALHLLGIKPSRQVAFGFSDGQAIFHLTSLIDEVEASIAGCAAVVTHAYEGGHPDHDACALAVQVACRRILASSGTAPQRLEFAGYHSRGGTLAVNCFWPDARCEERVVSLSWRERRLKAKAMREFRTQSFIMTEFPPRFESYREAPSYDFFAAPPPGEWFYDRHDWPMKGRKWLEQVALNRQALCSGSLSL
jgi:LmbE family N-acetylglucosaminyl deacetylase